MKKYHIYCHEKEIVRALSSEGAEALIAVHMLVSGEKPDAYTRVEREDDVVPPFGYQSTDEAEQTSSK